MTFPLGFRPTYIGTQVFFLIRCFLSPIYYFWNFTYHVSSFPSDPKQVWSLVAIKGSGVMSWPTTAPIECFHSRGQHLYKFIRTKESIYKRKEFNSHRTSLEHKHGRCFHCFGAPYGGRDVMWCQGRLTAWVYNLRN